MGKSLDQAYAEVGEKLIDEYGTLYNAFEQIAVGPDGLKELELDKKWASAIAEVAKENITTPSVRIDGLIEIVNPRADAIDHIKKALLTGVGSEDAEVSIHYVGAPKYRITVTAADYKLAEQEMKSAVSAITAAVQKGGGSATFKRKDEK
jgi:translation initiation factor 2 subunit 1